MTSSSANSLRPAWNRGSSKGFQPPPAVASERTQSNNSQPRGADYNKFGVLDPDEDDVVLEAEASTNSNTNSNNSRSEGLRRTSTNTSKAVGRSLADLAARAPEGGRRFSGLRSSSEGSAADHSKASDGATTTNSIKSNVVRFTRERLLSMRPDPLSHPPEHITKDPENKMVLSLEPQDPVCWDTFAAEEIWANVPARRSNALKEESSLATMTTTLTSANAVTASAPRRIASGPLRRDSSASTGGRWQRGVALPPPETKSSGTRYNSASTASKDAENPNDLWDDPVGAESGAAADFSAFGAMPDQADHEPFDFEKMAEASRKLEEELHGERRSRASSTATPEEVYTVTVDANRPLAAAGTTIRSGSGDNVNVFEDFGDADAVAASISAESVTTESGPEPAIQKADADPNASSRLMAMIGVKKDVLVPSDPKLSAWGSSEPVPSAEANILAGIPLNPWGGPMLSVATTGQQHTGLDLQAQLRETEFKQKVAADEAQRLREQEDMQLLKQQRQVEQERERQRQQQAQQQQPAGVQTKVEMVLMERICLILENSWGRSDLVSILSRLHAEDSRVIPLLSNVDALRALLLRNQRRVALRHDPALRVEMAALLITNAQWQQQEQLQQQQQQQQVLLQQQQEEIQRREYQRRLEAEQATAAAAAAAAQQRQINPDAPWYYSDPSNNIQGPFRGQEMRQWLEAGYFKGDLPICQNPNGPFRPLLAIFTDLSMAFVFSNEEDNDAVAFAAAEDHRCADVEAEQQRTQVEAIERERLRALHEDQERRIAEAQEKGVRAKASKAAATQQTSKVNGGNNDSSSQLKLMLGVGGKGALLTPSATQSSQSQQPTEHSQEHVDKAYSPSRNAAPAWGGAATSKSTARKSMSEIQKEEARAAALAATNRQGNWSSSSGWANVAASRGGSTGWLGGAAQSKPTTTVQTNHVPVMTSSSPQQRPSTRSVPPQANSSNVALANAQLSAAAASTNANVNQLQRSTSASAADSADAFGAKMSPELEVWCRNQLTKLTGTDDLTLVAFCMTLQYPDEIRQYLTTYLGSSPQVSAFASEFISRKGGSQQGRQEEWESTVPVKKGRKKKTGAR